MFVLQNTGAEDIDIDSLRFKPYDFEYKISKFDITLSAIEVGEEIAFNIEYCTKLFKKETIEKVIEHFINILREVSENPEIKISEIEMLSKEDKKIILVDFNDTKVEYPNDETVYELFEKQVEKEPDNIAVVFEDNTLTYRQLNEKANSLARILREKGVQPDTIVGIMAERSLEMMIGIMGILKAGGAYLPIDREYPQDRIEYMLDDSNTNILLTQNHLLGKTKFGGIIVALEDKELYKGNKANLMKKNKPNDLAYVIYTSGSTGKPKGTMIEHYSLVNRLNWMQNKYPIDKNDVILQKTPITFDVSVWELFWWSTQGSRVCLLEPGAHKSPEDIMETICKNSVTTIHFVPSMLNIFLECIKNEDAIQKISTLKKIFASGEALNTKQTMMFNNIFKDVDVKLYNLYGPTEATVDVTYFDCPKQQKIEEVSIGKPIDNIRIYILDKNNKIQPIRVAGEICIAGDGLARGYLNRSELTEEKFVKNPYEPGARMYRTGDLGRWMTDGNIEYLGRVDNQVKIRGFRIELGEIENELLKNDEIKEAVVIDREDEQSNKYLCAYIVCHREMSVTELRIYLSKELPDYMIPAYFMKIEKMPLTQNGKLDRKALPEPDGEINTGVEYIAPTNDIEEKLVKVWCQVLGVEKIGINDDFFTLGGHSLKAIQMLSIVHRELNVEVPIGEVFSNPTIRQTGEYIGKSKGSIYLPLKVVEAKEVYMASSAQKRLFALNQFGKKEIDYNLPLILEIEGKLEKGRVEEIFIKLVKRHEAFRTSFELENGEILQRIHKQVEFNLEFMELNEAEEKTIKKIVENNIKPFDLLLAPLLRVKLIKIAEEKHILMIDMHHIISDGISMGIIIKEFSKMYKGEEIEELKIQYKDYSAWQNKALSSENMKKQKYYWMKVFRDEIPVLDIPIDFQRPKMQSFEGESIGFKIDKHIAEKIKKIGKNNGTTLYMTLLTTYNILLSKYSGQDDIIVGSPIAGRPHSDLQKIVGMFVNTLAMRNYPKADKTFKEFLQNVKKNALSAYENQDYQFDELVEKLNIRKDLSRNALFDTMFVLQNNTDGGDIDIDGLKFKQYNFEYKISKFDITLTAIEAGEEIAFNIEYCTKLFKRETIERMIKHFINILTEVTENPEINISEIEMISREEKTKLLVDFNDTKAEYLKNKTIHELFEEQVEKSPDNIAVVFENKKLTYRELNEKSNSLARILREKGVEPDTVVGIMVGRSLEMIIGIMGILKAGGAYLPIDPEYPKDRIEYMIEDSNTNILLTQNNLYNLLVKAKSGKIIVDLEDKELYKGSKVNLKKINKSNDLAYVIYTSGSTGKPKGVMVEHKGIANLNEYFNKEFCINDKDRIIQFASLSFDASVWEIFMGLLSGASLYIVSEETKANTEKFQEFLNKSKISVMTLPPIYLANLNPDSINTVKKIITAGSATNIKLVKQWNSKFVYINAYGPTETTICATSYLVDESVENYNVVPIGKSIINSCSFILDKNNKLVPIGVAGELCISGDILARGYINKPELTKERFIPNPFTFGERMYRTGDLARWLPDGNIEFIGRIDNQVKIRGFRIELGEIENQLLKQENIKEAVVVDRQDDQGDKYLCAYIACDKEMTVPELREGLIKELPDYMVPAYFIQVEKMPLTPNGKIDKIALPEPDGQINTGVEYVAPTNETQEKLVKVMSEVLGIKKIGINDDFFILGAHSLSLIKILSEIRNIFNINLELNSIYKNASIKLISEFILKEEYKRSYENNVMQILNENDVKKIRECGK